MVLPVLERRRQRLAALPDRILFGSGYPNIAYPYLDGADSIINLDLGDDSARNIFVGADSLWRGAAAVGA